MKFLTKIKSIYLLAIVAILSFCMLLFPAMPSFANATDEEPVVAVMGTGVVEVKTARAVVNSYEEGKHVYEVDENTKTILQLK